MDSSKRNEESQVNDEKDEHKETKTKDKIVSYIDLNSPPLQDRFISAAQERQQGITEMLRIMYP